MICIAWNPTPTKVKFSDCKDYSPVPIIWSLYYLFLYSGGFTLPVPGGCFWMGKVLVIRGGALGDFILTLPAIRLLRDGLPKAEVEVLGYRPMIDLALEAGAADRVRSIDYAPMAKFFIPGAELDEEMVAYFREFAVVFSFLSDPDGIFRDNLERAGVETFFQGTWKVSEDASLGRAAEQLARICERLALWLEDPAPVLRTPRPPDERRHLAVHPGSGSLRKNWPFRAWKEAGPQLAALLPPGEELLLISGEAEEEWIAELIAAWKDVPVRHLRHPPLGELADTLAGCRAFLGHDTGVGHLAAACGIPCLALFGPTDPAVWAPANPEASVLRAPEGDLDRLRVETVVTEMQARAQAWRDA